MANPLVVGGLMAGAGIAGSLFGKKKAKTPDISQQLAEVRKTYEKNRSINQGLYTDLQPLTQQFKTDAGDVITGAREDFAAGKGEYLGETKKLAEDAKNALRANLYSGTFAGLPDTLRSVREAAAAGGGIDSGAYQQAVQNVGMDTARTLASGERDIQIEGIQQQQRAQENVFNAFNQLSNKLTDTQMGVLTTVLDTGREDLVRKATVEMGLNESETQAVVDLMNFRASGKLAVDSADDANRQALYNALITGGAGIFGRGISKKDNAAEIVGGA